MTRLLLLLGALATTGCLGPRPDPTAFYMLTPAAARGASSVPATLGLGPITLPGYLDRPQIVTRLSDHQVARSEADRWAEPLRDNLWRALAENLTRSVRPESVVAYPWHPSAGIAYGVAVDFTHFEADSTGAVRLEAAWEITDGPSGDLIERRTTALEEASGAPGTESSVAALSRALARLSDEIAAGLQRAHRQGAGG